MCHYHRPFRCAHSWIQWDMPVMENQALHVPRKGFFHSSHFPKWPCPAVNEGEKWKEKQNKKRQCYPISSLRLRVMLYSWFYWLLSFTPLPVHIPHSRSSCLLTGTKSSMRKSHCHLCRCKGGNSQTCPFALCLFFLFHSFCHMAPVPSGFCHFVSKHLSKTSLT